LEDDSNSQQIESDSEETRRRQRYGRRKRWETTGQSNEMEGNGMESNEIDNERDSYFHRDWEEKKHKKDWGQSKDVNDRARGNESKNEIGLGNEGDKTKEDEILQQKPTKSNIAIPQTK